MAESQFLTFEFDNEEDFGGFMDNAKADLIIREWVHGIADFAEDAFYRHTPYSSGRMLNAITQGRVNKTPYGYTVNIGIAPIFGLKYGESPEYPRFVEEGTGIFGPRGKAIMPQNGNVMAFEKLGEGTVFTRWVEGQKPQSFMDDIEDEVGAEIVLKKAELAIILDALT
jgi:hypothetical protein